MKRRFESDDGCVMLKVSLLSIFERGISARDSICNEFKIIRSTSTLPVGTKVVATFMIVKHNLQYVIGDGMGQIYADKIFHSFP